MRKYFVAIALVVGTMVSLPVETPAQTYGGSTYGDPSGYGNNAYLNRALTKRYKHKARSTKRNNRKRRSVRNSRSRRHSRR